MRDRIYVFTVTLKMTKGSGPERGGEVQPFSDLRFIALFLANPPTQVGIQVPTDPFVFPLGQSNSAKIPRLFWLFSSGFRPH